jgi:toxin-antitoxin system PIN domain toxin
MRALLDINVLLALFDADHIHHALARDWLAAHIGEGWASCPITQNGVVRIVGQSAYPKPLPPAAAIAMLREATATPHHEFWPDDASILDSARIDATRIHGPRQLTDVYLLALAQSHGGRFVTFDHGVPVAALRRAATKHLVVI